MTKKYFNLRNQIVTTAICLAAFFTNNAMAQPGTYNAGDIAVINSIIANNGLNWTPANPADGSYIPDDWYGLEWTSDITNKRIFELYVEGKNLNGTLDVSGLEKLENLDCLNNQLTAIDVSGLVNLLQILCYENQLTAIDVSGLVNMERLFCDDNQLTELDLSGLVNLQMLNCSDNLLTALDVSELVNLWSLGCSGNQLTALDVSGRVNLQSLNCSDNLLTALDVSKLVKLNMLSCNDNQLTELNLTGLTGLNGSWRFRGSNQSVSLTMEGSGTDYTAAIALNNPENLAAGITYDNGILTSESNEIENSPFEVQTGNALCKLSGTLHFTYAEETSIPTISIETGSATVTGYYDILGKKLPQAPEKGIYIIKYDNGKAGKVAR